MPQNLAPGRLMNPDEIGGASAVPGGGSYIVQESDGTSKFLLEDSSGSVLLE